MRESGNDAPKIYYVDAALLETIEKEFTLVDEAPWLGLYRHKTSGSLWRLAEWDKLQQQYFVEIDNPENWEQFDETPLRIELLRKTRGVTAKPCMWKDCSRTALNGSVFCEIHAYEMGVRK